MWEITRHDVTVAEEVTIKNRGRWVKVTWVRGSHTANVFDESGREIDCFTFGWEKDKATGLDFSDSLNSWMENANLIPLEEW